MSEREKVIKAIKHCMPASDDETPGCTEECPYFSEGFRCTKALGHDLIRLLEEGAKAEEDGRME